MRKVQYVNFTDTEIVDVLEKFNTVKKTVMDNNFLLYIKKYYKNDIIKYKYDSNEIILFCDKIIKFIELKNNKLRVKTNLKFIKKNIYSSIFKNAELSPSLLYWINLILEYNYSKYDIYDDIDNMEDNYKSMYDDYISEYDKNSDYEFNNNVLYENNIENDSTNEENSNIEETISTE